VLLSDRDILNEIDAGRIGMEPFDPAMVQPASIDVRLDRYFRVFENHRYPHIDPAQAQDDLTREVQAEGDEPFILHPGEFVLGSTYEEVSLPEDLADHLSPEEIERAADEVERSVREQFPEVRHLFLDPTPDRAEAPAR